MTDWRTTLTDAFGLALDSIADDDPIEDQVLAELAADEAPETPDLYTFYEALAVLRNEHRAGNRKSAETLSQLTETLAAFDRRLGELRADRKREHQQDSALPRGHVLALLDLGDRAQRLADALAAPPASPLFGGGKWPAAWENIAAAFGIFDKHVRALIDRTGVERIPTEGQAFDPERMNAVATVPATTSCPAATVARESSPGYLLAGEVLRLAEVEIAD